MKDLKRYVKTTRSYPGFKKIDFKWSDGTPLDFPKLKIKVRPELVAFGNPDITLGDSTLSNSKPTWIALPGTTSYTFNKIYTGARALGRVVLGGVTVGSIKIWEPGSGYDADPTVTVTDPNNTDDPTFRPRLADGALAQPTFVSKGSAYKTSTTSITVTGDGFADKTPVGKFLTLDGLTVMPGPGAQFYIAGSTSYRVAVLVGINEELLPDGTTRSTFQISPSSTLTQFIEHGMEVIIREKYSQVRLTNHDFLNVGYGSQPESGYPGRPAATLLQAQNQTIENNFGRVFYTSTDQDGNFKVGSLFGVEQATGIVTLSASQFGLSGLEQLSLGGIAVGGSSVVVTQFSSDSTFVANSDIVIPTQKAIKSYLSARLSQGGSNTFTGQTTAGTVVIGGPNQINNTIPAGQPGSRVEIVNKANFFGSDGGLIDGGLMALDFFMTNATKRGGTR
jgi:hypothetical protein